MKFYTHYSKHNDEVYVRYVDEHGNRKSEFFRYRPKYYLETDAQVSEIKTIYGKNVVEKESNDCKSFFRDIKEYENVENMEIHGCKNPALQYVASRFDHSLEDVFESSKIRRVEIDIETETEVSVGFPMIVDPEEETSCVESRTPSSHISKEGILVV